MSAAGERSLTLLQATRAVFRTNAPTGQQVERVYQLMKTGAIPVHDSGLPPRKWTTSEKALAEFMALRQMHKAQAQRRGGVPDGDEHRETLAHWAEIHREETEHMHNVYRGIWRDYFLAVLLRRRVAHRSRSFHRAVLAGQVGVLVILATLTIGAVRGTLALRPPPEQIAIQHWIDEQTNDFRVTRWHPPAPAADGVGIDVRVEYRYRKESPRWIQTDRKFRVAGGAVTELSL